MTVLVPTDRSRLVSLCFHGIGQTARCLEFGEERFWIDPHRFADILEAVHAHPRLAEITFDDSNESDFSIALPALGRLNRTARFFVISDRLDSPGSLSSEHVAALNLAGMSIGTHGATHRPWPQLAWEGQLDNELSSSTQALENITSTAVTTAAFPQGKYDRQVLAALKKRGFQRAYSVDEGSSRMGSWLRSRYTVIHTDTPESVRARLDRPDRSVRDRVARSARITLKGLR